MMIVRTPQIERNSSSKDEEALEEKIAGGYSMHHPLIGLIVCNRHPNLKNRPVYYLDSSAGKPNRSSAIRNA